MKCELKASLLAAWQFATESYSKVRAKPARKIRKSPKSGYADTTDYTGAAEHARYASMDARDYLDRHTPEHGC